MALFIDNTDRLLIPFWREFNKSLFELNPIGQHRHPAEKGDIQEYLVEWRSNRNLVTAGELISAAIINGQTEEPAVLEAARYVVESPLAVPDALHKASKRILSIPTPLEVNPDERFPIYAKIARLKKLLSNYPTSAILYVEIARGYMLLGQLDLAEKCIDTALYFDKNNRFVVRAAARFFIHRKNEKRAVEVLRNSELTKVDPWLMASEISVSRQSNKRSPNLKKAVQLIESKNFSNFDLSELCSTIGMEELENNGFKKGRKLFHQSLIEANDNSYAQAQWVVQNRNLELEFPKVPINTHYKEALTYDKFAAGDYDSALQHAIEWQDEMPYSLKCAMFGSTISTVYKKDYGASIRILSNYLKTNQRNKVALNDLAYAYVLNKDVENAQKKLDLAFKEIDYNYIGKADVCLIATQGLVLFRKGNAEYGAALYEKAIELSRQLHETDMFHSAQLNYAREILLHSNNVESREKVTGILSNVPQCQIGTGIYMLKAEVEKLLKEGEDISANNDKKSDRL